MDGRRYIKVILPVRLDWEPCYSSESELEPGDRVRVELARKEYVGVVHLTGIEPEPFEVLSGVFARFGVKFF